ncbi:hypothetical protein [Rhodococcus sovatensis]|uniref:Uncharacterized protein n=1 Tax=Rhodococcus sovatensis TaxID=1805840 RepID=A0ABZ2PII5_9NOCA
MNFTSEYFNSRDFDQNEQTVEFTELIVGYRDLFLAWTRRYSHDFHGRLPNSAGLSGYYLEWCLDLKAQSKLSGTGEPLRTVVALRAEILLAAIDLILRKPEVFDHERDIEWLAGNNPTIPRPLRSIFADFKARSDERPYEESTEASRLEGWYESLTTYDDVLEAE